MARKRYYRSAEEEYPRQFMYALSRGVTWGGALGYKSPPQLEGTPKILLYFGVFSQFFHQITPKFSRSLRSRSCKHNVFGPDTLARKNYQGGTLSNFHHSEPRFLQPRGDYWQFGPRHSPKIWSRNAPGLNI